MSDTHSDWNKDELNCYALLYCASVDMQISDDEIDLIKSRCDQDTFQRIYDEFAGDNDYQRIQKIRKSVNEKHLSAANVDQLLKDMTVLFQSDGNFDRIEKMIYGTMKRILSN